MIWYDVYLKVVDVINIISKIKLNKYIYFVFLLIIFEVIN